MESQLLANGLEWDVNGRQLRAWRTKFEAANGDVLTQAEAAQWYGCHTRTWRGFENGRYRDGFVPQVLAVLAQATTLIRSGGRTFKRVG